jgi:hypothetical protein
MSLHPKPIGPIPEETARIANAVFPRGSAYLGFVRNSVLPMMMRPLPPFSCARTTGGGAVARSSDYPPVCRRAH